MISTVTLRNFKSFGEKQALPLEPITVLVGPNNSGKSNFLSLGRLVRQSVHRGFPEAMSAEGGASFVFHRPPEGDGVMEIEWQVEDKSGYSTAVGRDGVQIAERISPDLLDLHHDFWGFRRGSTPWFAWRGTFPHGMPDWNSPLAGLTRSFHYRTEAHLAPLQRIYQPLLDSRMVKLSLVALQQDAPVVPDPRLGSDGAGLAAVLGLWRGSDLSRSEELDGLLRQCLPEVRYALVKPAPTANFQRLWIQQTDGEQFDAQHLSDGVLYFTALAMHAIDAPRGALIFIEEPEQSVHPRRLGDLVELFRRLTAERGCQFVIATHSPVLLNSFRDEPEAILLFRRGDNGTRTIRLADVPELVEALRKAEPGDMLANGFFNTPF